MAGALLLLAALLLGGCASPQATRLTSRPPAELPARMELDAVPFFPQEEYQCGPAALATVLSHAGIDTSPQALVPQVYLPAREGSLQAEMLAATRRHGLLAYRTAPQLENVLREIVAGNPVIVLQNLAFSFAPLWHYAVVIGYDLPRGEVVLRSGTTRRLVMSLETFEHTWARSGHWAMLALPPGRLPATATEETYVGATAALERVAAPAALVAYRTALARWPVNLTARIGLGNAAYALKDFTAAEAAYRQAVDGHPGAADAWNNLAQVLLKTGRRSEARSAAERAVELGGPRRAQYEETLRAITQSR